jgi:cardiolipin synthase
MFGPKSPQSAPTAQCVPGILLELQEGRNALAAVLRFLERSWQRSIADARRNPALLRSAVHQSALLEGMALTLLFWPGRRQPVDDRFRQVRWVSTAVLLQQGFIVLHLGMMQPTDTGQSSSTLGFANFLTSVRGVCAVLLVSGDAANPPRFALLCAVGGATDALDGAVARRFGQRSRVGQMLDPAMDVAFYSAAVKAAIARGALPRWFGWVVVTRFLLPVGAGLWRYVVEARPLDAAHTPWGKLAAAVLMALALLGTRRPRLARALCLPISPILIVAGALQCARALRTEGE